MCVLRLCSTVTLSCSWDRFKRVEKSWCCRSYSTAWTWSLGGSSKIAPTKTVSRVVNLPSTGGSNLLSYREPFNRWSRISLSDFPSANLDVEILIVSSTSCHHFRRRRQPIITRERIYQWKWISFTVGCYYFAFFCLWDVIKGFFFFVCSSYPQL